MGALLLSGGLIGPVLLVIGLPRNGARDAHPSIQALFLFHPQVTPGQQWRKRNDQRDWREVRRFKNFDNDPHLETLF